MSAFESIIDFILAIEGGHHTDPHDPGGETNFGISRRAYPDEDIASMTAARAREIYHRDYWVKSFCDALPVPIAALMMGGAVNQGVNGCIRCLQRVLKVTDDGIIGPQTMDAIEHAGSLERLIDNFSAERCVLYSDTRNFIHYRRGWFRRLMRCHALAVRLLAETDRYSGGPQGGDLEETENGANSTDRDHPDRPLSAAPDTVPVRDMGGLLCDVE
ncbi:MAG: glycosyl hydrolase 108 family protein [Planctomycetota bacterium]